MAKKKIVMSKKDLLLLILAAGRGKAFQPVQLQKVAFLLGKEKPNLVKAKDYYRFEAYDFGPFSVEVYRDAEDLSDDGLVSISLNSFGGWRKYSATEAGIKRANRMRKALKDAGSQELVSYIDETVRWALDKGFHELVEAIYEKYPEFKDKSIYRY